VEKHSKVWPERRDAATNEAKHYFDRARVLTRAFGLDWGRLREKVGGSATACTVTQH
jgi:hypothetical protein